MAKLTTYTEQENRKCKAKMQEMLTELPDFVTDFIYDLGSDVSSRTKLAYLYDVRRFLRWVADNFESQPKEITIGTMSAITLDAVNRYKSYLATDSTNPNGRKAEARKMSALNALYDFLYRSDKIACNPLSKLRCAKRTIPACPIVRLQPDETAAFLTCVEDGGVGSLHQRRCLAHTQTRDVAILTLLLGTGIRVSECVGLDIQDINFNELVILITRKGGKQQHIAMGDEVVEALQAYMKERELIEPCKNAKHALFLSSQKKRMCVRSVENLVKKYARMAGITKNITPHKLRKTYGTELYNATGDIYLVARALGHNNVNTTKDHYILCDEGSLINARNAVKLKK